MTVKTTIVLAATLLSACSALPVQELRQEPPTRNATFKANYAELADCIAESMQGGPISNWEISTGNLTYEILRNTKKKQIAITGKITGTHTIPIIDILVMGGESGVSVVESRQGAFGNVRRGGRIIEEEAWPMINACASQQQPPS